MIVSEKRQFVFVHIYKTAGTSIKRVVRQYAMEPWQHGANSVLKRIGARQFKPGNRGDHDNASDLIDEIGRREFDQLFSFAFVRNPWDWELSHYRYILKMRDHAQHGEVKQLSDFSEYIRWRCDRRFHTQESFLLHEGQPVVDFVGRFENLESDFHYVCRRIGIPFRLPSLNRTKKEDYRRHYDDQTRELVATTFANDIERFGYRFGSPVAKI